MNMEKELKTKLKKTANCGLFQLNENTTINLEMIEDNFFVFMKFSTVESSKINNMNPLMLSRFGNREELTLISGKGKQNITILNNKPYNIFETLPIDGEYSKNKEISDHVKLIYEMIRNNYKVISKIAKQESVPKLEVYYYCDLFIKQKYFGEILMVKK